MTPIRWGILGPGHIAEKFADALGHIEGASFEGVASRDADRAAAFGSKYGANRRFGGYASLAKDPQIDIIYIASPHGLHYEHARLCLENGKPVLCEKSLVISASQARELVEIAARNKVFLMEAMWTRFLPVIRRTEELIGEGKIGSLKAVRADFCFKGDPNPIGRLYNPILGGGALLDVGVYPLSLIHLLLGRPLAIQASASLSKTGVDETCQAMFQYKDQSMAQMFCAINFQSPVTADILGTEGRIHIPARWYRSESFQWQHQDEPPHTESCPIRYNGFEYQIIECMDCLRGKKLESPLLPHAFILERFEVMDEIRRQCGIRYSGL